MQLTKAIMMYFNKWLVGTAFVLAIVATVAVTWLHGATIPATTPTVGAAAANPAYVVVNTPTAVVITTTITDSTLLANGVNLLQTDASGKTLSTIGVMHDDGVDGDAKASDKIFSYRMSLNPSMGGHVYYRASAAFKGVLQRVLSAVTSVDVWQSLDGAQLIVPVKVSYPQDWFEKQVANTITISSTAELPALDTNALVSQAAVAIELMPGVNPHSLTIDRWFDAFFETGFPSTPENRSNTVVAGNQALSIETSEIGRQRHIYIATGQSVIHIHYGLTNQSALPSLESILTTLRILQ